MKLSALREFLHGRLSAAQFLLGFGPQLQQYRQALSKKCSPASIQVTEDVDLAVGRAEVLFLCSQFTAGAIAREQLAYIADGLQLSDRVTFADEWVFDVVAEFTDPEINGPLTGERANELLRG